MRAPSWIDIQISPLLGVRVLISKNKVSLILPPTLKSAKDCRPLHIASYVLVTILGICQSQECMWISMLFLLYMSTGTSFEPELEYKRPLYDAHHSTNPSSFPSMRINLHTSVTAWQR